MKRKMKPTELSRVKHFVRDEIRVNLKNQLLAESVKDTMLYKALNEYDFDSLPISVNLSANEIFVKAKMFDGLLKIDIKMKQEPIIKAYLAKESIEKN